MLGSTSRTGLAPGNFFTAVSIVLLFPSHRLGLEPVYVVVVLDTLLDDPTGFDSTRLSAHHQFYVCWWD